MKKTTKTLFSLLLVLVMVFQFGAVAPLAHAEGVPVSIYVQAPVDDEGHLSSNIYSPEGEVKDSKVVSDMAELSDTGALLTDGVKLMPPEGFAVTQLGIVPTGSDKSYVDVSSDFASFTEDEEDHAAIVISKDFFSDKFNDEATAYTLYVHLAPVTSIAPKNATCGSDGYKEYHLLASSNELYLVEEIPVIPATGEHTLEAVEGKAATCTEDGVTAHYKCSVCDKLFDGNGEDKKELTADDIKVAAHHDLEHVEAVEATAEKNGNIEYWKCSVCEKYFSDAEGQTEITDKDSVVVEYVAPTTYTVTFDANGHGTAPEAQTITSGEKASEPTAPTAEGFTFGGWFTEAACENAYSFDTAVTDNVTVYAKWTENAPAVTNVTLSFDANGGSGEMAAIQVESGKEYEVPACTFTAPENKEFAYWLRGDEHLKPGDKDTITTDNALVAMWKDAASAEESFTVTFDANGHGTAPAAQTVKSGEKASAPTAPTAEGFTFGGWFTEAACTNAYSFDTAVSANVTVYAKWTENVPTIIKDGTDTEWKQDSKEGLKIHIDAVYNDSLKDTLVVKVGDTVVPKDKYTVTSGSVTITIDPSYLATLPVGDHTITVHFPSGNDVTVTVTIYAAAPGITTLSITYDPAGFVKLYDGKEFDLETLKNYITVVNLPAGYKADLLIGYMDTTLPYFHDAGSTPLQITIVGVKDASNNDVSSLFTAVPLKGVPLTIAPRRMVVETRDDSKVYDGKAWSYTHMSNPQPIMTYTDPKIGEYVRDGKTYVQTISIKYTAAPKNMGTYENKAELVIREKEKGSSDVGVDVTKNYDITYKFGKIKITDSKGTVPTTGVATGDANNIWIWVGVMAAAVILVVVLLFVMRKNKKNGSAQTE